MTPTQSARVTPSPEPIRLAPEAIAEVLRELVHDALGWSGPMPEGELRESFDSLALMSLVVAVEDRFELCLEPEDECRIVTFDDLVEVVDERLRGAIPTGESS